MGEIKFIGALLMASLFAIAIVSYVLNFGIDNDAAVNLIDEPLISGLNTTLETHVGADSWTESVNESSEGFFKSTIKSGDEVMEGGGQFKGNLRDLINAMKTIFDLVRDKIFGGSAALGIVLTALSGFLVYTGIRYIYKTWVGKNPD